MTNDFCFIRVSMFHVIMLLILTGLYSTVARGLSVFVQSIK